MFMLLMTSDEEMKTTSEEITIPWCVRMSNLLLLLSSSTSIRTILVTNFYLIVHHSNTNCMCDRCEWTSKQVLSIHQLWSSFLSINFIFDGHEYCYCWFMFDIMLPLLLLPITYKPHNCGKQRLVKTLIPQLWRQ